LLLLVVVLCWSVCRPLLFFHTIPVNPLLALSYMSPIFNFIISSWKSGSMSFCLGYSVLHAFVFWGSKSWKSLD
jgi:hypothetical protein